MDGERRFKTFKTDEFAEYMERIEFAGKHNQGCGALKVGLPACVGAHLDWFIGDEVVNREVFVVGKPLPARTFVAGDELALFPTPLHPTRKTVRCWRETRPEGADLAGLAMVHPPGRIPYEVLEGLYGFDRLTLGVLGLWRRGRMKLAFVRLGVDLLWSTAVERSDANHELDGQLAELAKPRHGATFSPFGLEAWEVRPSKVFSQLRDAA